MTSAPTGRIFVKFGTLDKNQTKISVPLREDLNRLVLLRAVRNTLYCDNSAKRNRWCIFVANLNSFILMTATC